MSKKTRSVTPSSAKPTGERNKRREGLVKGAPIAQGSFSLSVTGSHAAHLPLPMLELESGRLNATSKKRQVRSGELGCFDYRPDDRRLLIELGVCCQGAAAQHDTQAEPNEMSGIGTSATYRALDGLSGSPSEAEV